MWDRNSQDTKEVYRVQEQTDDRQRGGTGDMTDRPRITMPPGVKRPPKYYYKGDLRFPIEIIERYEMSETASVRFTNGRVYIIRLDNIEEGPEDL